MRNLLSFFWNIFENARGGDTKFSMFCEFHLQGTINHNSGGIYDDYIAALTITLSIISFFVNVAANSSVLSV